MGKKPLRQAGLLEQMFTRQERLALGFLIGVSFFGFLVMASRQMIPPAPPAFIRLEVRVNTATGAELSALPGIGPKLGERIVEDRKRHGRYLTLTDLSRVKGITPKTLEKLKGLVRFD